MIYYINPMSYGNLAIYDNSLINHILKFKIIFFGSSKYDFKPFNSNVLFNPLFKYSDKNNVIFKTLSYALSLVLILQKVVCNRPKVVHIQWIKFWLIDFLFLIFLKILSIKVVYTVHNVVPHNPSFLDKYKYKIYYKIVDILIVHSESTKNELSMNFKLFNKIKVCGHGPLDIIVNDSDLDIEKERIFKELNLKGKTVFSVLGFQNFYKGIDLVIDLWERELKLQNKDKYKLVIWGKNKGVDFSAIANLPNVHIRDEYISDVEFKSILQLTNVLLMPYRKISQSGLLFTAINENIPVIVSNNGGLSEPFKFGEIGEVINNCSIDEMKFAMDKIIAKIENNFFSNEEFQRVKNQFSWTKFSNETQDIYQSLINVDEK